jgi:peptide-methionine (S)-S-oxide reductase
MRISRFSCQLVSAATNIHFYFKFFLALRTVQLNRTVSNGGLVRRMQQDLQKATFAAGCFWGTEAEFSRVKGVISTTVGYTGGTTKNPGYNEVSTGKTGHAESVEIIFDPSIISYEDLLEVFWSIHDPTTHNRQGPDIGTQYRSIIFYHTPEQESSARVSLERLQNSGKYSDPIVTEIKPASIFYRAEENHQQYFKKMGIRML